MKNTAKRITAVSQVVALALTASANIVYQEDFQKIGCCPAEIREVKGQVGFDNEPCWEQCFAMWVRPKEEFLVWKNGIPVAKGDFDLSFEFSVGTNGFDLVVGSTVVRICGRMAGRWPEWSALQLKARGGKAELWRMRNRVWERVANGIAANGLESVNVKTVKGSDINFKNVLSQTAIEGLVIDSSVTRFYADFASLEQPFVGTMCAAPQAVSVPDADHARLRFQLSGGTVSISGEELDKKGVVAAFSNEVAVAGDGLGGKMIGDYILKLPGLTSRYVRPQGFAFGARAYGTPLPQFVDLVRDIGKTPGATNHVVTVDFVKAVGGTQIWVDGCYIKMMASERPYVFTFARGAKYELTTIPAEKAQYQKLDFAALPKAKAFARGRLRGIEPGRTTFGGVPIDVARPIDSQDIAICHQAKGAWALEVEEYFTRVRSPLWGYPSESHFIVPGALYDKIAILFALDPDPKKDPVLTVTMGNYIGEVGGNKLAQRTIDFTDGVPESCKKVGEVLLGGKFVPLYYTVVPLDLGKVLDFTVSGDMDIEFTGKLWENFQQDDKSMRPNPASHSAFNLFGATLVRAGYNAAVEMSAPANVFAKDEKTKKTALRLTGTFGGKGTVSCSVTDVDEKVVTAFEKPFSVSKGESKLVELDFSDFDNGWYRIVWTVKEDGEQVFSHRGSLCVVPPVGRLVKDPAKSPYATWLFMGTHGAPTNGEWAATLLQKAGIRKASIDKKYYGSKYSLTSIGSVYALNEFEMIDKANPFKIADDYEEKLVAHLKKQLADKPFADNVMIWHESGPGSLDQFHELLGLPVAPPSDTLRRQLFRWSNYITQTGRIVRKHFPNLRLQIGNTSASLGAVVLPMRGGVDWSVFDSVGLESPSQMVPPERMTEVGLLGFLLPQTIATRAAGRKIPVNGCYEFIYRSDRDIGQELQAEYQARDVAICNSQGFTLISPGIFFDCSSGYYNGLWGGAGIMERGPWCYAKRAYVAYAVATKMMDGVTFSRFVDTGSSTIYAAEFKRVDGRYVTVVWSARGTFDFDFEGSAELVDLYGRAAEKKGSGRVVYVVSERALKNLAISNRAFPLEDGIFGDAPIVCDLAETRFTVSPDEIYTSVSHNCMPQLRPGVFEVEKKKDRIRGDVLEVTLKSDPKKTTEFWTEFTTLRFAEPIPVPGEPLVLGVEVCGNSNWGQFRFEIEDADGEIFRNFCNVDSWGCDIYDWPGRMAVAFDGWSWVCQSLHRNSYLPDHSPATYEEQWLSSGGDKKIRYPIKLRAITIGMNREKTNLGGFEHASQSIKLKSVRAK